MRKFDNVKKEFEKDFNNVKINNDTLKVKYINSIISDHVNSDKVNDEEKKKYEDFENEINKRLEDRPDVKNEIEEKLLKLQKDIQRGYRDFETSKGTLVIKFPGVIDDEEIELLCSKLYNRLLQDGEMLTESEIVERLEKRGVWSEEKEKEMEKVLDYYKDTSLKVNQEKLKDDPKMDKILALKKESDDLEEQYDKLSSQKSKHIQNSIETRVEELRLRSKLLRCVYTAKENGDGQLTFDKPYWNNLDELKIESKSFVYEIFRKANHYWNGVDPSFLE